ARVVLRWQSPGAPGLRGSCSAPGPLRGLTEPIESQQIASGRRVAAAPAAGKQGLEIFAENAADVHGRENAGELALALHDHRADAPARHLEDHFVERRAKRCDVGLR